MDDIIEKTRAILDYATWVGQSPHINTRDKMKMESFFHPDFLLTYNGKAVICGLEQLGQHYIDAYNEIGHFKIEMGTFKLLGKRRCIADYKVATEKKGTTPCSVIYEFQDGLCIGQHDVVDFSTNQIDTEYWTHVQ
jgi:hypothetical protein